MEFALVALAISALALSGAYIYEMRLRIKDLRLAINDLNRDYDDLRSELHPHDLENSMRRHPAGNKINISPLGARYFPAKDLTKIEGEV